MFSIILAAGKGSRMGETDIPKVCFPINGKPALNRSIDLYKRCGIEHHIVVIGDRAGEVAATVGRRFPDTLFVFQAEQNGTGHATQCGTAILDAFGYDGDVMVVAGDKVLSERAVRGLMNQFRDNDADACVLVGQLADNPTSGRIVEDDAGNILANIEESDIVRARLVKKWYEAVESAPLEADRLRAELLEGFRTERKARRAFGRLLHTIENQSSILEEQLRACVSPDEAYFEFIGFGGESYRFTADEIEQRCIHANLCVFFFKAEALRYALERLPTDNAQGEAYLTDAVGVLSAARTPDGRPRFRFCAYCVPDKTDALAYNSLEELERIRQHYAVESTT